MVRRTLISVVLLCVSAIISSCVDTYYHQVRFQNKSDEAILVSYFWSIQEDYPVKDVFSYHYELNCENVLPDSTCIIKYWYTDRFGYRGHFLKMQVFKYSTMDKYTKEELMENDISDKFYCLTQDELKAMNFEVVYKGD